MSWSGQVPYWQMKSIIRSPYFPLHKLVPFYFVFHLDCLCVATQWTLAYSTDSVRQRSLVMMCLQKSLGLLNLSGFSCNSHMRSIHPNTANVTTPNATEILQNHPHYGLQPPETLHAFSYFVFLICGFLACSVSKTPHSRICHRSGPLEWPQRPRMWRMRTLRE